LYKENIQMIIENDSEHTDIGIRFPPPPFALFHKFPLFYIMNPLPRVIV